MKLQIAQPRSRHRDFHKDTNLVGVIFVNIERLNGARDIGELGFKMIRTKTEVIALRENQTKYCKQENSANLLLKIPALGTWPLLPGWTVR